MPIIGRFSAVSNEVRLGLPEAIPAESSLAFADGNQVQAEASRQSNIDQPVGGGPLAALPNRKDDDIMTDEQKQAAAERNDPDLAARIVRSIIEIERDYYLASGPLSERMMGEVVRAMGKATAAPWVTIDTDSTAILVHPDWKMVRGVGNGDAWIELAEITSDEERDYTWIAAATRSGKTQLGLELMFRRGLAEQAQAAIRDDKTVAGLLKQGFVRDQEKQRLFIPIEIAAEQLAICFEQNDLAEAVTPVTRATQLAIASKADLDSVINQVRESGKRN